jgi:hypothetical protein
MVLEADPVETGTVVANLIREGRSAELEELFAPRLSAVVSADTTRSGQRRRSTSRCSSFKAAATTR